MRNFTQQITLTGRVTELNVDEASFALRVRSGDVFYCYVDSPEVRYALLRNLGESYGFNVGNSLNETTVVRGQRLAGLLAVGRLVTIDGSLYLNAGFRRVDVRTVNLLYVNNETVPVPQATWVGETPVTSERLVFETSDWWVNQIRSLADRWLFAQFGQDNDYDFANYRTNLDMYFKSKNDLQETATLSRLIYGFSSAYLLTGCERYLRAAQNGIRYQQENFRFYRDECCFWGHGKYANNFQTIFASINGDDNGTIPLYEQIYAIAGMTLYYRITLDEQIFDDIRRTILAFNKYFKDTSVNGGYFSHLSPEDFTFNNPSLGINNAKKNWNSVGDHIPAYLINLLLVIEPLANVRRNDAVLNEFVLACKNLLFETSSHIVQKFPDPNSNFVFERFDANWKPDLQYSWQQNRGIVGHNLKISWNLIRVANYYETNKLYPNESLAMRQVAERLAQSMVDANGVDLFRGGCFDALERTPSNGQNVDFTWASTKDFWQQEQGILAYLILYGRTRQENYLHLAQEMTAFWNTKFLDRQNGGVFFRVDANGAPVVEGSYGDKGGHAISGYHAFELCFLAHVYTSAYVTGEQLNLFFRPVVSKSQQILNVLPDYLPLPANSGIKYRLSWVKVNGRERSLSKEESHGFYVLLNHEDSGAHVQVQLSFVLPQVAQQQRPAPVGRIGLIVEKHYDEQELAVFRRVFTQAGYELVYITNLWGNKSVEYTSNDHQDPLRVTVDFTDVEPTQYAGFILIGGYAMDRLRYESNPQKGVQNQSPAVKFLRQILRTPSIKVGTICHSLWLFTVDPQLLQNRTVTCAHNVIYDVLNAGGQVRYEQNGGTVDVHVDGNLITAKHPEVSEQFAQRFLQEINGSVQTRVLGV